MLNARKSCGDCGVNCSGTVCGMSKLPYNVGKTIINHPFGNAFCHLFMVSWGMVYYCFTHISAFNEVNELIQKDARNRPCQRALEGTLSHSSHSFR
jgi:hypothetical protein